MNSAETAKHAPGDTEYELHQHFFTSGPRATAHCEQGEWCEPKFEHSHPGGGVPHKHPNTGPSFYGYRKPKSTRNPKGEQLEVIVLSEEESSFDLVVTDSAITYEGGKAVLIGNRSLESLGFPAAERMISGSRLKCIVRDEREIKSAIRKAKGE